MKVRSKIVLTALLAGISSAVAVLLLSFVTEEINWGKEDFAALFVLVTAGTFAVLTVKHSSWSTRSRLLVIGVIIMVVAALYIHMAVGLF